MKDQGWILVKRSTNERLRLDLEKSKEKIFCIQSHPYDLSMNIHRQHYWHPTSAIYNPSPSHSSCNTHTFINFRNLLKLFGFEDSATHFHRFSLFFLMTHSNFHIFCIRLGCRFLGGGKGFLKKKTKKMVDCFSQFSPSYFICSSSHYLRYFQFIFFNPKSNYGLYFILVFSF